MKRLLLPALTAATLLTGSNARAREPEIQCPGETTLEMRDCAEKSWENSTGRLQRKVPAPLMKQWQEATRAVCASAYASYKDGTIYPQLVVGCDDNLNRTLLKEFRPMDEQSGSRRHQDTSGLEQGSSPPHQH
jgi:hypothetical protein